MHDLAFSLLAEGRSLLVEVAGDERGKRFHARVLHAVEGRSLTIELANPSESHRAIEDGVRLIVPVGLRAWRFPVSVLARHGDDSGGVVVQWPEIAEQVEARRSPRVTRVIGVRCRPAGAEDASWTATYTLDISDSGLRMGCPEAPEPGARLELELRVADKALRAEGIIAWRQLISSADEDPMFLVGIQLDGLSESARSRMHFLAHGSRLR